MSFNKHRPFFLVILGAYMFFALFSPVLHDHPINEPDHDNCAACNWDHNSQTSQAVVISVIFLLLLLYVRRSEKYSFICLDLPSLSSRSPPLN
jgi:hypothetical protein